MNEPRKLSVMLFVPTALSVFVSRAFISWPPGIFVQPLTIESGKMGKIKEFWLLIADVWNTGLANTRIDKYLIAIVIISCFLVIRGLLSRFILKRLRKRAEKSKTIIDDDIILALERPVEFIPVVMGAFFAVKFLALSGLSGETADRAVRTMVVFLMFWILVNIIKPLSHVLKRLEEIFTPSMLDWLIKTIRVLLIFIGAATILDIWGIKIGPIIAGFGLLGVAVALGAQDLFKNLISGILILGERRFNLGDWIKVEGVVEGTVEKIGFRSTLVRRFDLAPVYVPNSRLSDGMVINFSKMTYRRIYWVISVVYGSTVDQLREIREKIEEYILNNDDFVKPHEAGVFVHIDKFSDSSIDIMIYCFTRTTAWGRWLIIKEELAFSIKRIVESAGSAFAFPSRSIYMEVDNPEESGGEISAPEDSNPPVAHDTRLPAGPDSDEE